MRTRERRRQLLLSTATLVGALAGYCRSAYAQACTGTAPNYQCTGVGSTALNVTTDNATVVTVETLSVTTASSSALTVTGAGAVSFTDNYNSTYLSASTTGLTVTSTGDIGSGNDGSVYILTSGTILGGATGVFMSNAGSGSAVIVTNGDATGTTKYGINASNTVSGTDISVTTVANTEVKGGNYGIRARSYGKGTVSVKAYGDVTGTTRASILARANAANSYVSVTTGAGTLMTGGSNGIRALNLGSGNVDVKAYGDITSSGSSSTHGGVSAVAVSGDVSVTTAAGTQITGGANGILARSYGAGSVMVTADGDVTGDTGDGIATRSGDMPITVTVGSGSTVTSTGTAADDFAVESDGAATTLTVSGALKGGVGGAVRFDQTNAYDDRLELRPGFEITTSSAAGAKNTVFAGGGTDTLAFGGDGNGAFNLANIDTGANTQQFQSFKMFQVDSGDWSFSGATTQDFTVNGGTLGGTGTFGGLTVNGGTVAPGNSIGTMTVNGAFTLGGGAIYEVEVDAAGKSDKVIVNGTVNLTGATLKVLAANGDYKTSTDYTIIENDGSDSIKGKFSTVTSSLAFLRPTVLYAAGDGNDVVLTLERNSAMFTDVARTRNQKAVAGALEQFPTSNALYLAVLNQTATGARQAFDALSGEIHATVAGTLVNDSRYAWEAVLGRMMQASHANGALGNGGPQTAGYGTQAMMLGGAGMHDGKSLVDDAPAAAPLAFWTQGYGAWGTFDGDGNAATADRNLGGFISGMDADVWNGWRVGLATGASFSDVSVDDRYSGANIKTYHLGGYVNGSIEGFALRGGGLWAWSEIETSRAVAFPNFYERQKADYDADTG